MSEATDTVAPIEDTLPEDEREPDRGVRKSYKNSFVIDEEATAEFRRVARTVREWQEARDGRLSSFLAVHVFGATPEDLEEMGLPPVPGIPE